MYDKFHGAVISNAIRRIIQSRNSVRFKDSLKPKSTQMYVIYDNYIILF